MKIFLTGDVMLGRGIDQILEHPGNPEIHEQWMQSSQDYVAIAEQVNGPVPRGVGLDYVWGHAFAVLEKEKPSVGIVNLETAVTARGAPDPKGINYRMNPPNVAKLAELGIGCCVLANNHVLDWGYRGLAETVQTLRAVLSGQMRELDALYLASAQGSSERWTLNLEPRTSDTVIRSIRLLGSGGAVEEIEVLERSGDKTVTQLSR